MYSSGVSGKADVPACSGTRHLTTPHHYAYIKISEGCNHRYNTADYLAIDPMLGKEEDFQTLCREAHKRGMRILLDGVFNHTGSVSRYFNADGSYPDVGAAQSAQSPYYNWYHFSRWPAEYDAWWGIKTLPAVEENHPDYREFIFGGRDSVVRHWLRCGADGWRGRRFLLRHRN